MKKMMNKKTLAIFIAGVALLALPLIASAEEKLVVQDAGANNVFSVDDQGGVGFNHPAPIYAADVVSKGNASKSQLHFSIDGSDSGGYLTSVLENNFWISSGAVYDQAAGGWMQKSADGQSVFFGSGAAGFRAYMNQGNTQGAVMTNISQVMLVDYSGNLTMSGGLQMNNGAASQPACSSTTRGMLWMTKGATDTVAICAQKGGSLAWYPVSF